MVHKVTVVLHNPKLAASALPEGRAEATEIYEFEVNLWYEAFAQLENEIAGRHPYLVRTGEIDDLVVKAMAIMRTD